MSRFEYGVRLQPDDNNTILVTSPDFPELTTFGNDEADALARAADALRDVIGQYMDRGISIPAPSKPKPGLRVVALPALLAAKVALWRRVQSDGRSLRQVATALGIDKTQLRRLMDPRQASRFDDVEAALVALGERIAMTVQPVAVKRGGKLTVPVWPGVGRFLGDAEAPTRGVNRKIMREPDGSFVTSKAGGSASRIPARARKNRA